MHVFIMLFYESLKKHAFYVFLICKSMFLTSMLFSVYVYEFGCNLMSCNLAFCFYYMYSIHSLNVPAVCAFGLYGDVVILFSFQLTLI